jgi:arginyl-tRNA synthetase
MNLLHLVQGKIRSALQGLAADVEPYVAMVKPTQDAKHGDYQANCAMSLAKTLGQKPRDLALTIADRIELGDLLDKPEVAGPGFINLKIKDSWLAAAARSLAGDERLGVACAAQPKKYVIDYSSPNVAKPLHVGHLRSTIIGDALARLLRFLGHSVVTDNHLGDWGTQFGILLYGYKNLLDAAAYKSDPVRELARVYVAVRKLIEDTGGDDDDNAPNAIADASRAETAKLHHGDAENNRLWQEFMPHCLAEINQVYRMLRIWQFDYELGESFYNPMLPTVVQDLEAKGIAVRSKGALAIFFGEKDPPALVQKTDGAFTYTTTDLATIQYRLEHFQPDAILYVVDFRQSHHFKQLFAAARRWGVDKVELTHVSFGSVLGKDGKPISTRKGDGTELIDLINYATVLGAKKYQESYIERKAQGHDVPDLTDEVVHEIAWTIGIGAVKYADLSQHRTSDYKFDYDKMLATEGNTAAYMQYAYARNRSIFRKDETDPAALRKDPPAVQVESPHERALVMQILRLEEALLAAAADYQPSGVTAYLWDLAKTYSGFFQNCPVLKAETPELKRSRLLLCDLTARVLQKCLHLLGIQTVERM